MQLFVRAQNLHTLEVTGHETVQEIKVRNAQIPFMYLLTLAKNR